MNESLTHKYPNKTAFITGAASGLGKAFATNLANQGWTLHLSDRDETAMVTTAGTLEGAGAIYTYELDVSSMDAYQSVYRQVNEKSQKVDLLINNAGIGDGGLFQTYDPQAWQEMININLMGVANGCHLFVPAMVQAQSGTIINVGSAAGFLNAPGMSAYNVSKAGVYALSETLYHELKADQVHVCVLTPTFFRTNVMKNAKGSASVKALAEKQMKYSTTNAAEVADLTLAAAAKGTFQVIHPKEARRNHFLKKWFPKLVEKKFDKIRSKLQ